MHRLKIILFITLLCLVNLGCEEHDEHEDIGGNRDLTVADIASALDMKFWNVRLPEDHGPDDVVSFACKYSDGRIVSQGGSSSSEWEGGTILKVIVWGGEDGKQLKYMFKSNGGMIKSSFDMTDEMPGSTSSFSIGKTVDPGDLLMKFAKNSSLGGRDIRPGDLGLIVHIEKAN